jgi:hypothetical protein
MRIVRLLLMITALVCFALSALGIVTQKFNLIAAGLFLWALAATFG